MIKERKLYLCREWEVEDKYGSDAGDDDGEGAGEPLQSSDINVPMRQKGVLSFFYFISTRADLHLTFKLLYTRVENWEKRTLKDMG